MTPPPHPRRDVARVVLLDPAGAVLLLSGHDPARPDLGRFWFTPGGGVEAGESLEDAARREVLEETGHRLPGTGRVVWRRSTSFVFEGRRYDQDETYFVVRTERFECRPTAFSEVEARTITGSRWWPAAELEACGDQLYPENLTEQLVGWREAAADA